MMETLDLGECGLQTVPLRFVLCAADGFGDGVFEGAVVGPELEFFEGGAAGEELGDDGLVVGIYEVGLEIGSFLTSRTLPTRVFCWSSRLTPLAVFILVFSMLRSFGAGEVSRVYDDYEIVDGLPEAILRVCRSEIALRDWEVARLLYFTDAWNVLWRLVWVIGRRMGKKKWRC